MPKSAPRRKHIRTARSEADPTSLPHARAGASNSQHADAVATTTGNRKARKQSSKKAAGGEERDKKLAPVIQKLTSESYSDRLWAVVASSHILAAADAGTRRALQSKNVVGLLIACLDDPSIQLQAEACGALRNLAVEGGYEVCAEMFNKSIIPKLNLQLAIVTKAFSNVRQGIRPNGEQETEVHKQLWTWIQNISTVFWCLAESSDKAFKAIVPLQPLSELLYELLKDSIAEQVPRRAADAVPTGVALSAAQAIYVLTDANVPSAAKFPLPRSTSLSAAYAETRATLFDILRSITSRLESSAKSDSNLENLRTLQVMIIGIYHNLSQQRAFSKQAAPDIEEEEREFSKAAFTALISLLHDLDAVTDADAAIRVRDALASAQDALSVDALQVSPAKSEADELENRWTRARLALEILGEVLAEVDGIFDPALLQSEEEEEWHGIELNGMQEEAEAPLDHSQAPNGYHQPQAITQDVRSLLRNLPELLARLAAITKISYASLQAANAVKKDTSDEGMISTQTTVPTVQAASNGTHSAQSTYTRVFSELFSYVHVRALECLNNLLITLARSSEEDTPDGQIGAGEKQSEPQISIEDDMAQTMGAEDESMDDDEQSPPGTASSATLEDLDAHDTPILAPSITGLQKTWEGLFNLLLQMHERQGYTVPDSKVASRTPDAAEPLRLAVEAACGSIWALARLSGDTLDVGPDEHRLLITTFQQSLAVATQADIAVRCVGALGVLASRKSVLVTENETISAAFFSALSGPRISQITGSNAAEIDVYAQILDSVMDIYADETREFDAVFVKHKYLSTLQNVLPTFRRLAKSVDKRKDPETRAAADAAALNLPGFIAYRKQFERK